MSTRVEIKRSTARLLDELKRKYAAKTIDETLRKLINKAERIPNTMLGAHPQMKSFTLEDEAKFRGQ